MQNQNTGMNERTHKNICNTAQYETNLVIANVVHIQIAKYSIQLLLI